MKTKITKLLVAVALAMAVQGVTRADIFNVVTITATAKLQSDNQTDNGTTTTTAAPVSRSITTKDILKRLAQDEFAAGNYNATNFPSGAKLVVSFDSGNAVFQVWGKTNDVLVDVSDILSVQFGDEDIFYGKEDDDTGLSSPTSTDLEFATLVFDDTSIVGSSNTKFFLAGVVKSAITDTKPDASSNYTEIQSYTADKVSGEGNADGASFMISGNFKASGKAKLTLF